MTDVELDARVTALEENGGGENTFNGKTTHIFNDKRIMLCFKMEMELDLILNFLISETIAFHAVLTSYSTIPIDSAVLFNEGVLNEGEGYVLH